MPMMKTIRRTAALGILSEHQLRIMLKRGQLPGVYCGNRYMVNVDALIAQINKESMANVKTEAASL